jgi:hypothetical protein
VSDLTTIDDKSIINVSDLTTIDDKSIINVSDLGGIEGLGLWLDLDHVRRLGNVVFVTQDVDGVLPGGGGEVGHIS